MSTIFKNSTVLDKVEFALLQKMSKLEYLAEIYRKADFEVDRVSNSDNVDLRLHKIPSEAMKKKHGEDVKGKLLGVKFTDLSKNSFPVEFEQIGHVDRMKYIFFDKDKFYKIRTKDMKEEIDQDYFDEHKLPLFDLEELRSAREELLKKKKGLMKRIKKVGRKVKKKLKRNGSSEVSEEEKQNNSSETTSKENDTQTSEM